MGNIVGESFKDYVANQINLRQKVHGKQNRSLKEISYLNSRTSWVKLASGVFVEQDRLNLIPEISGESKYLGQNLAKSFVLFNGVQNSPTSPKSGISGNSSNPAYGMLGGTTRKFGILPMPGIENVSIKTLEKGSIKRATIKIKAYNKTQFDIIDVLYLRLGYTLLLEWGDSHYLDNNSPSNPVNFTRNTLIDSEWFGSGEKSNYNHFNMLKIIEEKRKNTSGNYDALFGKIVNFKWSFGKDGNYDITLDVISLGDVIESLKMNIPAMLPPTEEEKKQNQSLSPLPYQPRPKNNILEEWVDSLRKITDPYYSAYASPNFMSLGGLILGGTPGIVAGGIGSFFAPSEIKYKYQQIFTPKEDEVRKKITIEGARDGDFMGVILPHELVGKSKFKSFYNNSVPSTSQDSPQYHKFDKSSSKPHDYLLMNFQPDEYKYFIRLGAFLKLLQDFIFPHYNSDPDNPIIKIDCETSDNLMYYVPNMTSLDPRVCIINSEISRTQDEFGAKFETSLKIYPQLEPFIKTSSNGDNSYGYVMNIYINLYHVQQLFKKVDKKGNLMLGEFLRDLCNDINKSLGSVNNLEPKIDEETNSYIIFDRNKLPGRIKAGVPYEFELFGYNFKNSPTVSNFVHNAGITTEITNDYAVMTTIGATAQNNVVGEDATSFSKWNIGIIDRFKNKITTGRNPKNLNLPPVGIIDTPLNNYYELLSQGTIDSEQNEFSILGLSKQYDKGFFDSPKADTLQSSDDGSKVEGGKIDATDPKRPAFVDPDLISSNLSVVSNFYKEIFNKAYKEIKLPSGQGGFMPFNLNLELDGISGIKIYNKLKVQNSFLPSNYPQTLEFIITDVTHDLSNNKWVTKLNTIGLPAQTLTTADLRKYLYTYVKEEVTFTTDTRDNVKVEISNAYRAEQFQKREAILKGWNELQEKNNSQ